VSAGLRASSPVYCMIRRYSLRVRRPIMSPNRPSYFCTVCSRGNSLQFTNIPHHFVQCLVFTPISNVFSRIYIRGELSCSPLPGSTAVLGKLALSTENPVTIQAVVVSKYCFGRPNTLLAIFHLEIAKKNFAAGSAEQLNSIPCSTAARQCCPS